MGWGVMEHVGMDRARATPRRRRALGMTRGCLLTWATACCALGAALPLDAAAQFAFIDPPRGQLERTTSFDFHADGEFGADLDRGTSFNRLDTGFALNTDGAVNRNFGLGIFIAYTYDGYDFANEASPTCAPDALCFEVAPWEHVNTVDIAPSAGIIFTPGLQLLAWVPMRFSFESGRSESPFTGGVIGALRMVFAEGRFSTTLGVGYMSELEESAQVFPVIGLDWRVGERWRLVTEGGPYEGGLATVIFGPSPSVKLRVSGGWERIRFRLSESGTRSPNGVGQQVDAPLLAGVDIRLSPAFHLEAHGGISVAGRLSIEDAAGNRLQSDYDVSGRVGGSLDILF